MLERRRWVEAKTENHHTFQLFGKAFPTAPRQAATMKENHRRNLSWDSGSFWYRSCSHCGETLRIRKVDIELDVYTADPGVRESVFLDHLASFTETRPTSKLTDTPVGEMSNSTLVIDTMGGYCCGSSRQQVGNWRSDTVFKSNIEIDFQYSGAGSKCFEGGSSRWSKRGEHDKCFLGC